MNIAIIGNNLTGLTLAKALVNKKINVTLFYKFNVNSVKTNRCIGITEKNLEFFYEKIAKIDKKFLKSINEIGIYFEENHQRETLNFQKKNLVLFSTIEIENLFFTLRSKLKKEKLFKEKKIKNKNFYDLIIKDKKYSLIINCEKNNNLIKDYLNQSYKKDYKSEAITCNLNHKKIPNNKAIQIFTKFGPLAFLPTSHNQTNVVFSMYNQKKKYTNKEILKIISTYNKNYTIKKVSKIERAKLKFFSARKYYFGKVLLFGDILHQIHPLAGQGFNMTLRDLEILILIIEKRINLGLNLDEAVLEDFEKKAKHYNFIYSSGINFLQEFFKFDSRYKNKISKKIFNFFGKNKSLNNFFIRVAEKGININY